MSIHIGDHVGSVAGRPPVMIEPEQSLRAVARRLSAESVGLLVVGTPRRPMGVISERDVVADLAAGADPDARTAEDAMTPYIIPVKGGDALFEAAGRMLDEGVRHLPVVDDNGWVVGMLSVRDLLRPLLLDALGHDAAQG